MTTARAIICNRKGLHARAAAKVVRVAGSYDAQITVTRLSPAGEAVSSAGATSILSLLMLAAEIGSTVEINATGSKAEDAAAALVALIERRFDEEE